MHLKKWWTWNTLSWTSIPPQMQGWRGIDSLDIPLLNESHAGKPTKQASVKSKYSKTQILDAVAAAIGLSRKQVAADWPVQS
ncbi:MAG: hypothetical protein DVB26_09000 [Verrucomicrobia bacterium]|nr:MAG: hypothetical protein DVB26_09000 [Verrucomicrobiota bacterium]